MMGTEQENKELGGQSLDRERVGGEGTEMKETGKGVGKGVGKGRMWESEAWQWVIWVGRADGVSR